MSDDFNAPFSPEEKPKSKTPIIIAIVVAVLLCFCCALTFGGWWLWNNGDALLQSLGGLLNSLPVLL